MKTVFLIETVRKNKDAKIQTKRDLKGDPKGIQRGSKGIHTYVYKYLPMYLQISSFRDYLPTMYAHQFLKN